MISASELRKGNLVFASLKSGKGRKIEHVLTCQRIANIDEGLTSFNFEPIPLTEEWLLKAGFEKIYESSFHVKYGLIVNSHYLTISFHNDTSIQCYLNNSLLKPMGNVHQLQNLYLCLTGEELSLQKIK